MVNSGHNPNVK